MKLFWSVTVSLFVGLVGGFFMKSIMFSCFCSEPTATHVTKPLVDSRELFSFDDDKWAEEMSHRSGKWVCEDPFCTATLDFRVIQFGKANTWEDLNGKVFLLSESMDFMTKKAYYFFHFIDGDPNAMTLLRKHRGSDTHYSLLKLRKK